MKKYLILLLSLMLLSACSNGKIADNATPSSALENISIDIMNLGTNTDVIEGEAIDKELSSNTSEVKNRKRVSKTPIDIEVPVEHPDETKGEDENLYFADKDMSEQELNEYLEYFNSDARIDLYLLYDKTERDYIYLTDIQTDNPVIYKINISKISGNISSINHNDIVKVTCNGAYTRDFELVKVYSILKVKDAVEQDGV